MSDVNLIPKQSESRVYSVEELNRQIRSLIEGELPLVWVQGELSNFKAHTSGHFYFSLKDSKSQISAVMFRGFNSKLRFRPTDGTEVIVRGRVTVYEPRGNYQITCETMEPVGAGALQKAFEQLKEKLKAEGLFDAKRKRPLPTFPRLIAVVTSPTGAAVKDILNILSRRNKSTEVIIVPTIVQGEAAAPKIVEALDMAYRIPGVEAIIVGRGGGSIEDMWCFNDETVARKISQSPVPIVSAVGHEIDFTIADFVADLRAPTPSAAAELVVKNVLDLTSRLQSLRRVLELSMQKHLRTEKEKLRGAMGRLIDPKRKLQDLLQKNDELFNRLLQAAQNLISNRGLRVQILNRGLINPRDVVKKFRTRIETLEMTFCKQMRFAMDRRNSDLQRKMAVLESLSPLRVVERGYSMTLKKNQVVKSFDQLKLNDEVQVKLMKGGFKARITELYENEVLKD